MGDYSDDLKSGDRRRSLTALRDLLAEAINSMYLSLQQNQGLCRRCGGQQSEGSLASMAARYKQVMDDLEALGDPAAPRSKLEQLREQRDKRGDGVAESPDNAPSELGTKRAERRKGSRRAGGERWADS